MVRLSFLHLACEQAPGEPERSEGACRHSIVACEQVPGQDGKKFRRARDRTEEFGKQSDRNGASFGLTWSLFTG